MTYSEAADVADWVVKGVEEEFAELTDGTVEFRSAAVDGRPATRWSSSVGAPGWWS